MNSESKIDEKGRVCIPIELRKKLKLKPGENVLFHLNEDNTISIRKTITPAEFIDEVEKFKKALKKESDKPIIFEKLFE